MNRRLMRPAGILDEIESDCTDTTDPYRVRIEKLMAWQLEKHGNVDTRSDAEHLRHTGGGLVLETAARYTGFILGVEYCRNVLETKKGRVR